MTAFFMFINSFFLAIMLLFLTFLLFLVEHTLQVAAGDAALARIIVVLCVPDHQINATADGNEASDDYDINDPVLHND